MWFRKANQSYYVQLGGRQVNLGKDKRAAQREEHRLMGLQPGATKDYTVRAILEAYAVWLLANRSAETCLRRQPMLEGFGASIPASLRIQALRPFHVQKWVDTFKKRGPTSRNNLITAIKAAINWGVKMGYAEANPIAKMEKPTAVMRQEFVPADQWPKLLAACSPDLQDVLTVMLDAGARVQEMFKYEACHFEGARLTLPIVDSKGKKRSRVVNLPPVSLAIVQRLAAKYPTGKLFRTAREVAWDRNSLRCRFRPLKKIMAMPKLCGTTLRHSFCHYRLTSKQDAVTVAALMNHVDTRMVSSRYGHLQNSEFLANEANRIVFPSLESGSSTLPNQPVES